jgi:hypothetical protein
LLQAGNGRLVHFRENGKHGRALTVTVSWPFSSFRTKLRPLR